MAIQDKATRKFIIISAIITLVLIVIIVILDLVFYFKRIVIFSPYKAKIPDSQVNQTKSVSKALTSNLNTYYCPNGCPDPKTGKPVESGTLNSAVINKLNSNFNQYLNTNPDQNRADWYYYNEDPNA